jgi:hypothetical protein
MINYMAAFRHVEEQKGSGYMMESVEFGWWLGFQRVGFDVLSDEVDGIEEFDKAYLLD